MLDNQQTWQLAGMYWEADRKCLAENPDTKVLALAKKHLGKLSRIGLTETFDSDFQLILSDLKISGSPVHMLPTPEPICREQLAPGTLQALRERLQLDYQLYDFAKTLPSRVAANPATANDASS